MPTVTLQATQSCFIKSNAPTTNFSTSAQDKITSIYEPASVGMLVSFAEMPANLRSKQIASVDVHVYLSDERNVATYIVTLEQTFIQNTATYSNISFSDQYPNYNYSYGTYVVPSGYSVAQLTDSSAMRKALKNGIIAFSSLYPTPLATTTRGANRPYIVVHYEEPEIYLGSVSPQGGFVPKTKDNTFSWKFPITGLTYDPIVQTSAVFRWRTSQVDTPKIINLTSEQSVTIPAYTFTTSSIEWQVSATASTGETITSPWYTLTTVEVLSTARTLEPVLVVVDGSAPVTLHWQHVIGTGTPQRAVDVEISTNGTTFTTLYSAVTAEQSYTAPANTFMAGSAFWRVRTYNTDNAVGTWSDIAKFVVLAAPPMPVVSVTASPRPVIRWQSEGQQAFEVEIGDIRSGLMFGIAKSFRSTMFVNDGSRTARVRVQNQYNLWSEWGAASFTVANVPGEPITLSVISDYTSLLSWSTIGYDKYYIYRNNILIAKTTERGYIDNTAIGTNTYQVRGAYNNSDNYGLSNQITTTIVCETVMIADLISGFWQKLEKTATSDRINSVTEACQVTYMHFAGNVYPSIEISEFKTKKYGFEAAFKDKNSADNFSKLLGNLVCVKDQWGNIVIGVLTGFSKGSPRFYQSFTCEVEKVAYNEVIQHD